MRKVDRELVLGAGLWIVWGVGVAIGKRLGIAALTADKTEGTPEKIPDKRLSTQPVRLRSLLLDISYRCPM